MDAFKINSVRGTFFNTFLRIQNKSVSSQPVIGILCIHSNTPCPGGGIGRRAGLKHLWETVPVRLRSRVQEQGFFLCSFLYSLQMAVHSSKLVILC
jgi:hypothetical protein